MGIPPSYDPVIINFNATLSELLTLNNVIARLLNEEVQQSGDSNIVKDPEDKVMAVTSGKGHGVQNSVVADITCFFCTEKGHFKSDCPEKRAWEKLKKLKGKVAAAVFCDSDFEDDVAFWKTGGALQECHFWLVFRGAFLSSVCFNSMLHLWGCVEISSASRLWKQWLCCSIVTPSSFHGYFVLHVTRIISN